MASIKINQIQKLASDGKLEELIQLLGSNSTLEEINIALELAIAYSHIRMAEYLLTLGGDLSYHDYEGTYYAVHNNEIEGLKFAISKGVDINVMKGMLLNTGVQTSMNTKNNEIVIWLLDNGANPNYLTKKTLKVLKEFGPNDLNAIIKKVRKPRWKFW